MDDTSAATVTTEGCSGALPRRPLDWLKVFGPGAIIASLTIGTGELVFSSRGGALFGYRILFLFVVISLLKWSLVVASSRHMVLTGVHPYARMLDLPGPRRRLSCRSAGWGVPIEREPDADVICRPPDRGCNDRRPPRAKDRASAMIHAQPLLSEAP